ncbi:hypothetical protein ACWDDN_13640 [Streptomyces griseoruber]
MNTDRPNRPVEPATSGTWTDVDVPSALDDPLAGTGWASGDDLRSVFDVPLPTVGWTSPDDVPSALDVLDADA